MVTNIKQCTIKLPDALLQAAADRGILVRTDGGRYFGLSRIVETALSERVKGAA